MPEQKREPAQPAPAVEVNVEQPDEREVDSTFPGVTVGDDGHERMDMPNQQVVRPETPDPPDPPDPEVGQSSRPGSDPADDADDDSDADHERR